MIRVLLVDDHTIVRKGIISLLEVHDDIVIAGEAETAPEMFQMLRTRDVNIVILDISLPGRSGIDALKQMRMSNAEIPVLVLSMHPAEQYALRVLQAGASGYLSKESAPEELISAIRQIISGRKYVSTELAQQLANFVDVNRKPSRLQLLTDREMEVLRKIAQGGSLTEIASQLSLSVKTISTYKSRLMQKLNLQHNSDIIRFAMEHNLA